MGNSGRGMLREKDNCLITLGGRGGIFNKERTRSSFLRSALVTGWGRACGPQQAACGRLGELPVSDVARGVAQPEAHRVVSRERLYSGYKGRRLCARLAERFRMIRSVLCRRRVLGSYAAAGGSSTVGEQPWLPNVSATRVQLAYPCHTRSECMFGMEPDAMKSAERCEGTGAPMRVTTGVRRRGEATAAHDVGNCGHR